MKKKTQHYSSQIEFSIYTSEVIKLSDKASRRMINLLSNPPEPTEFLKLARNNYHNNIKNNWLFAFKKAYSSYLITSYKLLFYISLYKGDSKQP